ncbi:MAG: hypothetical protein OXC54_02325 [Rhodospirillaceae bacterium]|nr:hypothetical protein [Rhodospirillaceae bacterium]
MENDIAVRKRVGFWIPNMDMDRGVDRTPDIPGAFGKTTPLRHAHPKVSGPVKLSVCVILLALQYSRDPQ